MQILRTFTFPNIFVTLFTNPGKWPSQTFSKWISLSNEMKNQLIRIWYQDAHLTSPPCHWALFTQYFFSTMWKAYSQLHYLTLEIVTSPEPLFTSVLWSMTWYFISNLCLKAHDSSSQASKWWSLDWKHKFNCDFYCSATGTTKTLFLQLLPFWYTKIAPAWLSNLKCWSALLRCIERHKFAAQWSWICMVWGEQ